MNDSQLDQLLKDCGTSLPSPAGFERDVWFRIEAAEAFGWKAGAHLMLERLWFWLAMPSVAVATCGAMVLAGAWLGLESGKSAVPNELAYVQSISPFTPTHR